MSSTFEEPTAPEGLPAREARSTALFQLLDDDSPHVWTQVRHQLVRSDRSVEPKLRKLESGSCARLRTRARRILLDRRRARTYRRLASLALQPRLDLERGFMVLSQLENPSFDARPYRLALDAMAREVKQRADALRSAGEPGIQCARSLCRYLGEERSYSGSADDYHHPDNVFLHRAIERRTGMPLTLCALYLLVARRAGLRAGLVPLPGHVLLRLYDGADSLLIDPFHGGEVRTERQCLRYLAQHGLEFRSAWFRDADDRTMLARQIANLRASWMARGLGSEVRELSSVLAAMSRKPPIPIAVGEAH